MRLFREGMNEDFYLECESCGGEFYTDNEDNHVSGMCDNCQDGGGYEAIDNGNYCLCEDRPCCGH